MNDPFFISPEALHHLFDSYFHLTERNSQVELDVEEEKISIHTEHALALLFPGKGELNSAERKFISDVLAAIGLHMNDTVTYFRDDLASAAALESLLSSHPCPFAFLMGHLDSALFQTPYRIELVAETQVLVLEDPAIISKDVEKKRQLWTLIKHIRFKAD